MARHNKAPRRLPRVLAVLVVLVMAGAAAYVLTGQRGSHSAGRASGPPASTATPVVADGAVATAPSDANSPADVTTSPSPSPATSSPAASPSPSHRAAPPTPTYLLYASEVLDLVNQQRAAAGCKPLAPDTALHNLAQAHSADMQARGYFSHTTPDGKSPWDRAAAAGITDLGAENIAMGQPTPQAVMTAWMNSPGHRANILDCSLTTSGVGVVLGSGGPWWTQDFGR